MILAFVWFAFTLVVMGGCYLYGVKVGMAWGYKRGRSDSDFEWSQVLA